MNNTMNNNVHDVYSQHTHMQRDRLKDQYSAQVRAQSVSKAVAKSMKNHMAQVMDHINDPNYDINGTINVIIENVIFELKIKDRDLRIAMSVARTIADAMINEKKEEIKNKNGNIGG